MEDAFGELDCESFVSLLSKLIGESKHVQNNPPDLIPEEDRVCKHVLEALNPYAVENGGPLIVKHISYVQGRGNIIVEYPGSENKVVSFVGSHMDVVPANPEEWEFDPFNLSIEGDKLRGRGTTDCLGHVALITELMRRLGEVKPNLKSTVVAVFIANEENSTVLGVGVDALVKQGLLDKLKHGPLFWIDTADKQPCIGTGGVISWKLYARGKLFHSGLPHKAINAMELCMEALDDIQKRFYNDFPAHPKEEIYGFATPSTMKPTQWSLQIWIGIICFTCLSFIIVIQINNAEYWILGAVSVKFQENVPYREMSGLTPFYKCANVVDKLKEYVDDINANIEKLKTRGPVSKYVLPQENIRGSISIEFGEMMSEGVACSLDSPGYHVLCKATKDVVGYVKPYSITGSLPLIRDLQDEGFDVQTTGYGIMATYHAKNEHCLLSDFQQGFKVCASIIAQLEG